MLSSYRMTVWMASEMLPMEIVPQQSCAHLKPCSGYPAGSLPVSPRGARAGAELPDSGHSPSLVPPTVPQAQPDPQLERSKPLCPTQDKTLHGKCRLREMYISRCTLFYVLACILAVYLLLKLIVKLQKHMKPPEF